MKVENFFGKVVQDHMGLTGAVRGIITSRIRRST